MTVFGPLLYLLVALAIIALLARHVLAQFRNARPPKRTLQGVTIEQIHAALRAGQKIDAIQLYREMLGCSLAEATSAIEVIEARMPRAE